MKKLQLLGGLLVGLMCSAAFAQSVGSDESVLQDLQNPFAPTGTTNFIPVWTSTTKLGNSSIFESRSGSTKGYVGIGTTSPAHNLHIVGQADTGITLESSAANGNPTISVIANSPAGAAQLSLSRADGGAPAIIYLQTAGSNEWTVAVPDGSTEELDFSNGSGSIALALLQGGQVGIGTNTPSNLLTLVQGGGPALADGWSTYSSRRFKTNIQPLLGALTKVEQLQGVSYQRKSDGKQEVGVIAEDVGSVLPEIVSRDPKTNEIQGVDYSRLSALLIEAVKTQQKEIDELKVELQGLASKQ
jgi:hypothetical protein